MLRYLLHRLGRTLTVLAAVTTLLFVTLELQPGGVERAVCGGAGCPAGVADELAEVYGFGQPLPTRALAFASSVVRLDFGPSLASSRPSTDIVREGGGPSTLLVAVTLALEVLFLAAVALANGVGEHPALRATSLAFSVGALVVPLFWLGMVVRAAVGPGLAPAAVVLAFGGIGFGIRQVHERVRTGLDAAHVRLARTYDVPERRIALRHGLRPAVPTALESLAGSAGVVLGGLVLLEPVFGRAGVGAVLASAIARQDRPLVLAGVYVLLLVFVALRTVLLFGARLAEPPRADRWSAT